MSVETAIATGLTPTSTGTVSFEVSGFGTPQAAIVHISGVASAGSTQADNKISYGFTDGASDFVVGGFDDSGLAASNTSRFSASALVRVGAPTETTLIEGVFSAWSTNGLTINFTKVDASQYYVTVTLIKGCTNVKVFSKSLTVTGLNDITTIGFKPNLVYMSGIGNPAVGDATNFILSLGAIHNNSSNVVTQGMVEYFSRDGVATATSGSVTRDDSCVGQYYAGTQSWLGTAQDFDSSGFTINTDATTGNDYVFGLALDTGDTDGVDVSILTAPTTTGVFSFDTPAFKPQIASIFTTPCITINGLRSGFDPQGFGVSVFNTTTEIAMAVSTDEAATVMNLQSSYATKAVQGYYWDGANHVLLHEATLDSFDSLGYNLNFSTVNGTARQWLSISIKEASVNGLDTTPVTKSGTYTGNGTTQSISVGFAPDFIIIASDRAEQSVFSGKGSWYSNTDYMSTGTSSSEAGAVVTGTGFDILSGLTAVNENTTAYHYFAFKNNDSNTILHTSYQGNATVNRTMDTLVGKNPLAVIEKRDGPRTPVWATKGKPTVSSIGGSLATRIVIETDGKLTLDASNESNQWDGASGEAMSTLAFLTSDNVDVIPYTGNGTGGRTVSINFLPDYVLIYPLANSGFSGLMWFSSLSAGEHIPVGAGGIGTGRITSVSATEVTLPNHNSTNENAIDYVLIAVKANATVTDPYNLDATKYNKEIQLSSGYIDCGTSDTLKIDGLISLEWFGSINPASISKFAGGTADTQTDKQYPLICRSDGADNRVDDTTPTANMSFAIETTNSISAKDWVGSTITVASHNFWSLPDGLPITPPLDHYPMNTGRRIDQEGLVHIIAVHYGNGYWVIYENGVPVKERKRDLEAVLGGTYPAIKNVQGGTGHTTVLGARKRVGATPEFDHDMYFRMARIYDVALTATEARNNFLSVLNLATAKTGFIEEWDARNASGTSMPATVSSANDGTIVNGTIVDLDASTTYSRILSDTANALDQQQAYENKLRLLLSSVSADDSLIRTILVAGTTINRVLSSTISINDLIGSDKLFYRLTGSNLNISDAIQRIVATIYEVTLSSNLEVADALTTQKEIERLLVESLVVLDSVLQDKNLIRLLSSNFDLVDIIARTIVLAPSTFNRILTDSMAVQDAIIREVTGQLVQLILARLTKAYDINTSIVEPYNIKLDSEDV